MTGKKDLPRVAVPPNAPEGFDDLLAAALAALQDYRPQGETKKKRDHLHAKKALALLTAAAYHLSQLPDDQYRQGIVLEAALLIDALVKENDALQRGAAGSGPDTPSKRLH